MVATPARGRAANRSLNLKATTKAAQAALKLRKLRNCFAILSPSRAAARPIRATVACRRARRPGHTNQSVAALAADRKPRRSRSEDEGQRSRRPHAQTAATTAQRAASAQNHATQQAALTAAEGRPRNTGKVHCCAAADDVATKAVTPGEAAEKCNDARCGSERSNRQLHAQTPRSYKNAPMEAGIQLMSSPTRQEREKKEAASQAAPLTDNLKDESKTKQLCIAAAKSDRRRPRVIAKKPRPAESQARDAPKAPSPTSRMNSRKKADAAQNRYLATATDDSQKPASLKSVQENGTVPKPAAKPRRKRRKAKALDANATIRNR